MALIEYALSPWAIVALAGALVASYLHQYFVTYGPLRRFAAPFQLNKLHKKLGKFVRIQPNHISIADDEAINLVYGHSNGFLKSEFYDAFVSIRRGLFNTRDRAEHTRKRKMVSHTFSAKSIVQFEPYIHQNLELFVQQMDRLVDTSSYKGENGRKEARIDCLPWFNYLAFDVIGDLAFGAPFGMLEKGVDLAEVRDAPDSPPIYAPAIEILNRRGEVSATLGCFPALKPYAKYLPDPFYSNGLAAIQNLAGIAIACVKRRLDNPPDVERKDLLARLIEGRDDKGEPLGREELTAEALTQLIAGSDTTSNSSCALLNYVVRTPGVLDKMQAELDTAIPRGVDVPTFEMVRDLPYLAAVINETLRHHSTSGIGLPRQVPRSLLVSPSAANSSLPAPSSAFPPTRCTTLRIFGALMLRISTQTDGQS
ncbi:hypothetical protein TrVFT333_006248 [Trichoderma virens FT-333]|nr:hypothetical protein TrVFT333_006248 [Trichoderma virens FT-333]